MCSLEMKKQIQLTAKWVEYPHDDICLEVSIGDYTLDLNITLSKGEDGIWYYVDTNKLSMSYVERDSSELDKWVGLLVNTKLCDLRVKEVVNL